MPRTKKATAVATMNAENQPTPKKVKTLADRVLRFPHPLAPAMQVFFTGKSGQDAMSLMQRDALKLTPGKCQQIVTLLELHGIPHDVVMLDLGDVEESNEEVPEIDESVTEEDFPE